MVNSMPTSKLGHNENDLFSSSHSRKEPEIWSVSRLSGEIRRLLEDGLPLLWIEGEISNYKLHSSGHRYFTLKDESAQIACTMWRTRTQPAFQVKDGQRVRVYGRVTVWEQGGRYQFDVVNLLPVGIGALQAAFEALKQKLTAEGLFAQSRKRPLPRFPRAVGIITSPTGAVIHDLTWGFATRFPPARLFLLPVAVQGEVASTQIAEAIVTFNRLQIVDVIIVARGGGSLEDIWPFNEEVVVRAVVASGLPVVSAVGHEVDITLCDLAADIRAPTPTAAAALVAPDRRDLLETLEKQSERMNKLLANLVHLWRERLQAVAVGYGFRKAVSRIGDERQRIDDLARTLETALNRRISDRKNLVNALAGRVSALSPKSVLDRGYSVVFSSQGGVVRRGSEVSTGDRLRLQFAEGRADATVNRKWNE
jgi:exodeoxyribonuclease VII large subunit